MSDEERAAKDASHDVGRRPGGRAAPSCPACGGETRFAGGSSTHDLYAERFVCIECGRETYRSFGRGSVS